MKPALNTRPSNFGGLFLSLILTITSFNSTSMLSAQASATILNKYKTRPTSDILIDLFQLKKREMDGEQIEQPMITLTLMNKQPVSGFLIDLDINSTIKGVSLQNGDDAIFVELHFITSLTLHDADRVVIYLVEMKPSDINSKATRLEIKSTLAQESDRLTKQFPSTKLELDDSTLPTEPAQLFLARLFITDVAMALVEIGKTELGKSAVSEEISRVVLKFGQPFEIRLENKTLHISNPLDKTYCTNSGRHELITKISDTL